MKERSIKIKVVDESPKRVTIRCISLNRKMPVPREEYEKRVKEGVYEVID